MLSTLGNAIGLGFVAGAMPGPLLAFAMVQSLQLGFRRGVWVVPAPWVSDGPILVVCLAVLTRTSDGMLRVLAFLGSLFLLYLAATTWRQLQAPAEAKPGATPSSGWGILGRAALINGLGPGPWIFWSTVTGPLLVAAWRESMGMALLFLIGFFGTFAVTLTVEVALFSFARRLGPRIVHAGSWLGWALMIVFAGWLLWTAISGNPGVADPSGASRPRQAGGHGSSARGSR